MANLIHIVHELEKKLGKLINQQHKLLNKIESFEAQQREWQEREQGYMEEISSLQKSIVDLKHANALLGSDQHSKETKRMINALIKEIDVCIEHLAED